jgi:hypothetical protein
MEEAGDEPLFCERTAGIDIGKQVVSVTIRVPSDTRRGGRQQETREFGTTRRQLLEMADWLRCWQVERAGMEATPVIRGAKGRNWTLSRSCRRGRVRDERTKAAATRGSGGISAVVGCLCRGRSLDNPSATGAGTGKRTVTCRGRRPSHDPG